MKSETDERTLCGRCAQAYIYAGYTLVKIWKEYKEPCDKCARPGWAYMVKEKPPD